MSTQTSAWDVFLLIAFKGRKANALFIRSTVTSPFFRVCFKQVPHSTQLTKSTVQSKGGCEGIAGMFPLETGAYMNMHQSRVHSICSEDPEAHASGACLLLAESGCVGNENNTSRIVTSEMQHSTRKPRQQALVGLFVERRCRVQGSDQVPACLFSTELHTPLINKL